MYAYIVTVGQIRDHADVWGIDLSKFQGMPDNTSFAVFSEKTLDFLPDSCQADFELVMDTGETIDATPFGFEELGLGDKNGKGMHL